VDRGEFAKVEVFALEEEPAESNLTINLPGTGTGEVECKFNGGGLEACEGAHPNGTEVELFATATGESELSSLTGSGSAGGAACQVETATTGSCTFTLEEDSSVTATFDEPGVVAFQVQPTGTGTGTVECKDEAGSFEACHSTYLDGHTITLKATPNAGHSSFGSLTISGSSTTTCTGTFAECTVKMEEPPGPVVAHVTFNAVPHTLGITIVGSGEVKCKVNGGPAEPCASEYNDGTELELVPLPGTHFSFSGWSEGAGSISCTGTSNCGPFDLNDNSSVKATFVPIKHTLGITVVGTGEVKCKVNGGSAEPCAPEYNEGTELELVPLPGTHFSFTPGWSEGTGSISCTGTGNCGPFDLEANSSVKATFTQITHTLTVTKIGSGTASVSCKEDAGAYTVARCSEPFNEGHTVGVKTTAAGGSGFVEYKEGTGSAAACNGVKTVECTFTIEADSTLKSETNKNLRPLSVTIVGTGSVECKVGAGAFGACAASYNENEVVKLREIKGEHFAFAGWSEVTGSGTVTTPCAGTIAECEVKMSGNVSLKATFTQETHTLTISLAGTGAGSVTCNGGACAPSYNAGTSVTIAATANAGSTFAGFSGGCSGTSCTVTMGANTAVTATFNLNPPPPPECKVPKLKGLALRAAKSAITKAHCAVGPIHKPKPRKGKKLGPLVVKSSSPPAGAVRPAGTKVSLTLGPKPKRRH